MFPSHNLELKEYLGILKVYASHISYFPLNVFGNGVGLQVRNSYDLDFGSTSSWTRVLSGTVNPGLHSPDGPT